MTADLAHELAAALEEVRGLRTAPAPDPVESTPPLSGCCPGDRAGYLRHRERGDDPCAASRAANTAYFREYRSTRRGERAAYMRRWRSGRAVPAQRDGGEGR